MSDENEEELLESMIEDSEDKPKKRGRPAKNSTENVSVPTVNDVILSKLESDEIDDNGYPKTAGLRRIFSLIKGELIRSQTTVVQAPSRDNGGVAVVEHLISYKDENGEHITYQDVGEASLDNADPPYNKFLTSVAASRAEGRVLRKALGLTLVVSEELNKDIIEKSLEDDGLITSTQINVIGAMCKRNNIDVLKFINIGGKPYSNIEEIEKVTAAKMLQVLNGYQRDQSKIPAKIKGYDPSWNK